MKVERTIEIATDPATVWRALTDPEITQQYYFGCEACSDWQVGSDLQFKMTMNGQEIVFVHGIVRAVEPNRLLEHTCVATGTEGTPGAETRVVYTLTPKGPSTELHMTQGEFLSEEERDKNAASWDMVLGALKELLEGES